MKSSILPVIANCPITHTTAKITTPWIAPDITNDIFSSNKFHSGVDIVADSIFSICQGVVVHIGQTAGHYSLVIQYDMNQCIVYAHLSNCKVSEGDIVNSDQLLGIADRFVHFEYLTRYMDKSIWPFRINLTTYYKQDPMPLLLRTILLSDSNYSNIIQSIEDPDITYLSD